MSMEDFIIGLLTNIADNFDLSFCIVVNVITYFAIQTFTDVKKGFVFTTWQKRLVFLVMALICGVVYKVMGADYRVIFNSIIIAPVSWSWIFKPIYKRFNLDYSKKEDAE